MGSKAEIVTRLASIDLWLLIFGVIVVIGVGGESIFGIRHWWNSRKFQAVEDLESTAQQAQVAGLNAEIARLNADAARLNADAEQAKQKQAEAELKVERLRYLQMPRWVDEKPFLAALKDQLKPSRVLISYAEDDESERLANQFEALLYQAGWPITVPAPLQRAPNSPPYISAAESLGGQTSGLSIVSCDPLRMPAAFLEMKGGFKAPTPFEALWFALGEAKFPSFSPSQDPTLPAGIIRIIVGRKPAFVFP